MADPDAGMGASMDDVASLLRARRTVLVSGELDAAAATQLAASLLTLDATGDERIELRASSCTGSLDAALAVIDVLDVLGVPVHATAIGTLEGGPVGVFAACDDRRVAPHAMLVLREPAVTVEGSARDLERGLAAHAAMRRQFLTHLAGRIRRPVDDVEAEWARVAYLEAGDAVTLRYADGVLAERPGRRDRSG